MAKYGYKADVYPGGRGVYKIRIRGKDARKLAAAIPTFEYDEKLGNEKAKKLKALLAEGGAQRGGPQSGAAEGHKAA